MRNLLAMTWVSEISRMSVLALAYPEHLSPTCGAHTLGRRLAILHGYCLGILHFLFGTAFNTVSLHWSPPS